MTRPVAPGHLSLEARRMWLSVARNYEMEPQDIGVLTATMEAFDRYKQAGRVLDDKGLTYLDRFGAPHARPEVKAEVDYRTQFFRGIRELDLRGSPAMADLPRVLGRR